MSDMIDPGTAYNESERDKFFAKRGVEVRKAPDITVHVARLTPINVPMGVCCEARVNGQGCFHVPELMVWTRGSSGRLVVELVCVNHYVKRVAHMVGVENRNFQEVRHDILPDWYDSWVKRTYPIGITR